MTAHASLSPSSASRWGTCPGSVALGEIAERIFGPEPQNDAAAAGTACHNLAEQCLLLDTNPEDHYGEVIHTDSHGTDHVVDEDMGDKIQAYLDYARAQEGEIFIEERVSLEPALPDVWGTADLVVCNFGHLKVVDLKTGYHVVDAPDNWQLYIYAMGAFVKFNPIYEFEEITVVISQPKMNHHSEHTLTLKEMKAFAQMLGDAVTDIQENPLKLVPSESACQWCRARAFCPELQAEVEGATSKPVDILGENMSKVPLVKAWLSGVENATKDLLIAGGTVPGFKVVEGRKARKWENEEKAMAYLARNILRFKAECTQIKYPSPAQMEKLLKKVEAKREIDLDKLIVTLPGNPTVAPESDPRPVWVPENEAVSDFEEFKEE